MAPGRVLGAGPAPVRHRHRPLTGPGGVNPTAEFSRIVPSAGFYVTYLGRTFGTWAGAMGAAVCTLGQFIIGMALFCQLGIWTSTSVGVLFGVSLPWWIPTLVIEAAVALLIVLGVRVPVRARQRRPVRARPRIPAGHLPLPRLQHPRGAAFPFITGATQALPGLRDVMYVFTSAIAVLLAAGNAVNRVWFSMARDGLLPRWLGVTHSRSHSPARVVAVSLALMMAATLALGAVAGAGNGFSWTASLGTIGIVLVFIAVNVALPAFYYRRHRPLFRLGRHLIAPLLGTVALAWPLWQTIKQGQAWPCDWFGVIWIGFLLLAAVYAAVVARRGVVVGQVLAAGADAPDGHALAQNP